MKEEKTLKEFLYCLISLSQSNIEFIKNGTTLQPPQNKYQEELSKIQNLINSFDFVKNDMKNEKH